METIAPGQPRQGAGPLPVTWRFVAFYALANVGGYIAFIPLLQVLLPLRAAVIDPVHDVALLSRVSLCGAVVASLANILFGAFSDRTLHATGSRRPWLAGGLLAVVASFAAVRAAGSVLGLFAGIVAFQLAFNAMFAPLGAVLADRVPSAQRGLVSGLLGLGYPLGNLVGTQAVGSVAATETQRFVVVACLVVACVAPFIVLLGRTAGSSPPIRQGAAQRWKFADMLSPLRVTDFVLALTGRLLVVTASSLFQGYLFTYLNHASVQRGLVEGAPETAFARLAALVTCASTACALVGGAISDRVGRRALFVFAAGAGMAAGMVLLSQAHSWFGLQLGSLVYGCGAGQFYAVDLALIVQVLPSLRRAGQHLGLVNLSNTVPQIVAPLIVMGFVTGSAGSFRTMFLWAAGAALLGGACPLGIRGACLPADRRDD